VTKSFTTAKLVKAVFATTVFQWLVGHKGSMGRGSGGCGPRGALCGPDDCYRPRSWYPVRRMRDGTSCLALAADV